MEVRVLGRKAIEALAPPGVPHAIVSITSAPDDQAALPESPACRGVLRLSFLDLDIVVPRVREEDLFSRAQAQELWDFVVARRESVDQLLVHCDAGQSRSPAVAAALARAFGEDERPWFEGSYVPNRRVYALLREVIEQAGQGG